MTLIQRLLCFALPTLVACGGDLALPVPSTEGVALSIVDGDDQTGRVGEELPKPLVVSVHENGSPIVDHPVAFSIVSAPAGVRLEPDTALTDDAGRATTHLVLGPEMGSYEISATLSCRSLSPRQRRCSPDPPWRACPTPSAPSAP